MRYYRGLEPQRLPLAPRQLQIGFGAALYAIAVTALVFATIAIVIDSVI